MDSVGVGKEGWRGVGWGRAGARVGVGVREGLGFWGGAGEGLGGLGFL